MKLGSVAVRGRMVGVVAGVWLAGMLLTGAAVAEAQEVPFDGLVAQGDVVVRAGAGNAYYEVGRLERGTPVRVEEILYGWNRVRPPEGVYSYISKMNVDARGDGRMGEVNSNRVSVTAASVSGPGQSYRRQVVLNEGDTVRIVGEDGSFYKIEPPAGAPVYLPPGSVYRADSEQGVALREQIEAEAAASRFGEEQGESPSRDGDSGTETGDERLTADSESEATPALDPADRLAEAMVDGAAADPDPVADPDTDLAVESEAAAAVERAIVGANGLEVEASDTLDSDSGADSAEAMAGEPGQGDAEDVSESQVQQEAQAQMAEADADEAAAVETVAVSATLREVERRNIPLLMQPLEDQPIDRMIADYQAVREDAENLPASDRRLIRMRLAELERNQRLAETILRIQEARQRSEEREADMVEPVRLTERRAEDYDAVGRLLASGVYDGRTLPRMFRLVDPGSGRTIAYIEPDEPVRPHRMLGRMVGVKGRREYNQAMGLYVFKVRQIDTLEVVAER